MGQALQGVKVVDLSRLLPGPYCTWYLAQLGAEVVKVEDRGKGDYTKLLSPALYELLKAGKSVTTIPFREQAGKEALLALIATADVVVESFRPGVMTKLGLDYPSLKQQFPHLVYASLTGYGQTGPNVDLAGHDINYLAHAGILQDCVSDGGEPIISGIQIADLAGALNCVIGIQAGLLAAHRTGKGCHVDVAMADASMALQVFALHNYHTSHAPSGATKHKNVLTGILPNYDVYRCADGRLLAVGALEQTFWHGVCEVLGWSKSTVGVNVTIKQQLTELLASKPLAHWRELFADTDICVTPVLSFAEALQNPQFTERGMVKHSDKPQFSCPIIFTD